MSKQGKFLTDWKNHYVSIFSTMYPDLNEKELSKFIKSIASERAVSPKGKIHNNYNHKEIDVDLLTLIDWYDRTKPIAAGFGVFFKNQDQELNPSAVMLDNFLTLRKSYKDKLKEFDRKSYEYATFDRLQGTEKINANSFYGCSGNRKSNFFNLYTASSTTSTGQSIISTTELAYEAFLTNNVTFIDLDDCMNFMENIIHEKKVLDDRFLPNISVELLIKRLKSNFQDYKDSYEDILFCYILNLNQRDINRIYFKNNLYEFSSLRKINNMLTSVMLKVDEFKNPSKVPDIIKSDLKELWDYYGQFVFYNHFAFDRIQRLKNDVRKSVLVIDTDSNFIHLNPWFIAIQSNIVMNNTKLFNKDPDQMKFIIINIMCYFMTEMITLVLARYCKYSHVPKKYRPKINMKNEFFQIRVILAPKKKRYVTNIRLREGVEIFPPRTAISGHDFMKSTTREATKVFFTNLVKTKMIDSPDINISEILRELERFEDIVRTSLINGEKDFLLPKSVKSFSAYKFPFRETGFRAVIAFNYIYPDMEIQLPEKLDIVKVKLGTLSELEKLKGVNEDYYNIFLERVFNNPEKAISEKGVQAFAIPRSFPNIPDWLRVFIDVDTIVNDNLSRFTSILESLQLETIKTSRYEYFSNILKI